MNKEEILAILSEDTETKVCNVSYSDKEILDYLKAVSFTGKDGLTSMATMGMSFSFGASDCCGQNTCAGISSCTFA